MTASWAESLELIGLRNPARPDGNVISYGVLLGWISLALGTYGIVRGLDFWMKRFAAVLIACFVLGLGEALRIPGVAGPVLPLPFVLWRKIPLLGIMRGSVYFWIMVQVCVAVLAGYGASKLWERLESRQQKFPILRPAVGTVLLVLMLTEVCLAPFTPISLRIHPVYEAVQRDGQGGAILDAPIGYTRETVFYYAYYAGWSMYLQTLHNQPLVGGYTQFDGRKRLTFLEQHRLLTLFMEPWPPRAEPMPDGMEGLHSFLTQYHISWIILRKGMRDPRCDQQRMLGWTMRKLMLLLAPAAMNEELRVIRSGSLYCGNWGTRVQKVDALVRQTLGLPVWDDDELVAYRVR